MRDFQYKLERLIRLGSEGVSKCSESEMTYKVSDGKWSKKEILGHLIDSGIKNLQRFTEIQFEEAPYSIRNYKQNELVIANGYQHSETNEILDFWNSINNRILYLFSIQNEKSLSFKVILDNGNVSNLKFLMEDYVKHLEHHLNQILS